MKKVFKVKEQCYGCGACEAVCPTGAITMKEDQEGFPYPQINRRKCVNCSRCQNVCHVRHEEKKNQKPIYLGVQAKEDSVRYESTSGGAFLVFAANLLAKGGVVFGAVMDENGAVYHREAHTMEEVLPMQKSKYVQSSPSGCYEKIKRNLEGGRLVLFSGTPCQCKAVKLFLEKEYQNLLLVDMVCYGVPSPGIWRKYVRETEKKYGGKLSDFCFRDKRNGDDGHTISFCINGTEYAYPMGKDSFCREYFQNYIIRPSCYLCGFCTVDRESDITLGDFWGIGRMKPEMDDGMGTSLLMLHTEKAKKIWEEIKEDFRYIMCEKEDILQPRLREPTGKPKGRQWIILLHKFLSVEMTEKIIRKVK